MPARRTSDFQPEIRKSVVTREWVIIARGRGERPSELARAGAPPAAVPVHDPACPFCPGGEANTPPEVLALRNGGAPNGADWRVRVVPNRFAALRAAGSDRLHFAGIFPWRDGFGAHEVIIETPRHDQDLWQMDEGHVADILEAFRQRCLTYETSANLPHVLLFRNHGPQAGTSLVHPHSQLIAAPVLPHQVELEMQGCSAYWEYLGRCVYCAIIEQEQSGQERVVVESDHFLVVTAFAARYPYETWVLPKRHSVRFADVGEEEVADLAWVLKLTLGKIAGCLGRPSYNLAIHSAPMDAYAVRAYHWHLEVIPRITTLGGFELGSSVYINVAAPEEAAAHLRASDVPLDDLLAPAR